MPPKGWTSGRPEGFVKAVRLTEETIARVTRHIDRLQKQLSFVRVNEGMAIRNLIETGLDTVEARAAASVEAIITPTPVAASAPPLISHETLTPQPQAPPPPAPETPPVVQDLDTDPETVLSQPSMVPTGMKQCKHGHAPYPMSKSECPGCARDRMRRKRQSQADPQPPEG